MAAPVYALRDGSVSPSPVYSTSATDGEIVLALSPPLSRGANLPDRLVFQSQRMRLDLGDRFWPVQEPCYGYAGTITGTLSVLTLENVKRIDLTVKAVAKASLMERGVLVKHLETTLFQRAISVYTTDSLSYPASDLSYQVNLSFPTTCDHNPAALPPSFLPYSPSIPGEVYYSIVANMTRSGFRRRETLEVPILYLPRSYVIPAPLHDADSMKEIYLTPKAAVKSIAKHKHSLGPATSEDVQAKISLPSPLVVASGERIPFIITLYSRTTALAALYTNITLQLVKLTTVKAQERSTTKESILFSGEAYEIKESESGAQVLRGELGTGSPGTELSWRAGDILEVEYVIKLSIKPPPLTTLSANLLEFEGLIALRITTHRYPTDEERSAPALGLAGLSPV